jgi:hypothetical protein
VPCEAAALLVLIEKGGHDEGAALLIGFADPS